LPDDEEKPQNASLLRGMKAEEITLDTALRLLSLPRELGKHPDSHEPVIATNGRFGPYVKCGSETRSLPATLSPLDVTLDQALELLAQPKAARRSFGASREPLKILGDSPVTQQKVQLFEGRYGPYVSDGQTNASVPKETPASELTLDRALELLAARAAAGPPRKAPRRGARRSAPPASRPATAAKNRGKKRARATSHV
jgi:DNA topoisomerase-1